MIGAQSVYAETGYPPPAAGANFTDSQGMSCTFGPNHNLCLYQHLERIPGTINYRDYHSAFKVGLADGRAGEPYHHAKTENATASWSEGYYHGWNKGMVQWGTSQGLKNPQENADLLADASTP